MAALAGQPIFPMQVDDASPRPGKSAGAPRAAAMLAVSYSQLADLLRSGVPLLRALEVIAKADVARRH